MTRHARLAAALIILLTLPLVAAMPTATDPDTLLRQGDAAYRDKNPGKAAELYERAGLRTLNPSRSAFNTATARFAQAREGQLTALGEAEINYRACLDLGNPLRARAMFGLGNCLMIRAAAGRTLDRAALKAAIDRFAQCLKDPRCNEALAKDARYNRARARLLLLQAPPFAPGVSEEPPPGDEPKQDDDKQQQPAAKQKKGGADGNGDLTPSKGGTTKAEQTTEKKDGKPGPGKGAALPTVSDSDDAVPLAKEDAALHLELAARRILEEAAAHRRGKARPVRAGVRDW